MDTPPLDPELTQPMPRRVTRRHDRPGCWRDHALTREGVPVFGRVLSRESVHDGLAVRVVYRYQNPLSPSVFLSGDTTVGPAEADQVADGRS